MQLFKTAKPPTLHCRSYHVILVDYLILERQMGMGLGHVNQAASSNH